MGVHSQTYSAPASGFVLTLPDLAFRKIISVKREGSGRNIIRTGTVGNRQVLYGASDGSFTFDTEFTYTLPPFLPTDPLPPVITEKVFIIWNQ